MNKTLAVIWELPKGPSDFDALYTFVRDTKANCVVFKEGGHIHIYPKSGGCLSAPIEHFTGDLAPFCD